MPATRRTGLRVERAVGRIRGDVWDDLWPDVAALGDLPTSPQAVGRVRRELSAMRRGSSRQAEVDFVPKADGLTRPGHYLWTSERIYYQALVDTILHRVDGRLGGRGNIFGYRALNGPSSIAPFGQPLAQWKAFRQFLTKAAKAPDVHAVVRTDVSAFFERIPQVRLEAQLRALGVPASTAGELRQLLTRLMDGTLGLPQGSDPSSVLASAYLQPVDSYMLRKGYKFFRYVDDMFILSSSEAEARHALRELEEQLRALQLQLQSGKTEIVVGKPAIKAKIIEADSDVASVAFYYRRAPSRKGLDRVKCEWRVVSRRKPFPSRLGKYLLRRIAAHGDPVAVEWCLRNLGVLDWLVRELGPYLAHFADSPKVQRRILEHLGSPMNDTCAEESALLRVLLSARTVQRRALDMARLVVADRNRRPPSRQWAVVLLGRHGDAADHRLVLAHHLDDERLARAAVIAAQGMDAPTAGLIFANVGSRFPAQLALVSAVRGRARPDWPVYRR